MKRNLLLALTVVALSAALVAQAQNQAPRGVPVIPAGVDPQMRPVYEMVAFATVASDLGVQAALTVAQVYPPEKVAHIQELSMKYNELKKNRKDGNLDADEVKLESDITAETAGLDGSWQSYQKEKVGVIPKANKMLGLMILADTMVGLKAVQSVQILLNMGKQAKGNPLGMIATVTKFASVGKTVQAIAGSIGGQKANYARVKAIVKNIAEAEKMSLAGDPPAGKVQDVASLHSAVTELDDSGTATPGAPSTVMATAGDGTAASPSASSSVAPQPANQQAFPAGSTLMSIALGLEAPGTQLIVKVDGNKVVEEPLSYAGQLMQLTRTVKVAPGSHRVRVAVWHPPAQPAATEWDCQIVEGQNQGFTVSVDKNWNVTKTNGS